MQILRKFGSKFTRFRKPKQDGLGPLGINNINTVHPDMGDFRPHLQIKNVAIFGYADTKEGEDLFESVVAVTQKLAQAGYTVVDGGGPGVMKAATVGAKQGRGQVIGVTLYPKDLPHFEGRDPTNKIDIEIKTDNYVERTLTLMKEGQVYVVFNGGTGTISEFGMAWGLARLYFGHHKPLILYGNFWHNIMTAFQQNMKIRAEEERVYKIVNTAQGVLDAIRQFETELEHGEHDGFVQPSKENGVVDASV